MHQPTLVDTQGRTVRDLRISVTDRCNLRCVYCMPAEGMPWLPKDDLLTYEEITRFARVCLALGVTGIRLTGGEPTVRADLPVLVRMLNELAPGSRPLAHHQRPQAGGDGRRAARRGAQARQRQPRHARPRALPPDRAPRPASTR